MPNQGRYTVCPFYRDHKKKSISCEDCVRTFEDRQRKDEWMDRYCDLDWKMCPYSKALWQVYEDMERGDDMAYAKHKIEALETEIRSLKTLLGKSEHRYAVEKKRADEMFPKLLETAHLYEARFCYLMEMFSGGMFSEVEFQKWSDGKEFRLIASEKDADGNVITWKAEVREAKDEDTKED